MDGPSLPDMAQTRDDELTPLLTKPPDMENQRRPGFTRKSVLAFSCIGLSVALERFAYYSLSTNLGAFSSQFFKKPADTLVLKDLFDGTIYFLPIFGATFADAYIGQYRAVVTGSAIYLIGLILQLVTVFTCNDCTEDAKVALFFTAMCLIALGCSLYKPNITIYSAYQATYYFGENSVKPCLVWFYWMVAFGSLFASLVTRHVHAKEYISVTGTIAIAISLVLFLCGSKLYVPWKKPESKTLLLGIFKIAWSKITCKSRRHGNTFLGRNIPDVSDADDSASRDASRRLWKICLVFGVIIIFWIGYGQLLTSFHTQMILMTCQPNDNSTECMADVGLNLMNSGGLLVFLPAVHLALWWFLRRRESNVLMEMGAGFLFMTVSMVIASVIELCKNNTMPSGWLLLPQVLLLSFGESLSGVAGYYFAFTQSPDGLEGLVIGLQFGNWAIANYICILSDPYSYAKGNFAYYFFGVAGLLLFGLALITVFARKYEWAPPKKFRFDEQLRVQEQVLNEPL